MGSIFQPKRDRPNLKEVHTRTGTNKRKCVQYIGTSKHKKHFAYHKCRCFAASGFRTDEVKERANYSGAYCTAHRLDLPIALALALRLGGLAILPVQKRREGVCSSLLRGPLHSRVLPFRHVYAKPRHETPKTAQNEQDWESLPVVSFLVDYHLDHIRSNNCRGPIRQSK